MLPIGVVLANVLSYGSKNWGILLLYINCLLELGLSEMNVMIVSNYPYLNFPCMPSLVSSSIIPSVFLHTLSPLQIHLHTEIFTAA